MTQDANSFLMGGGIPAAKFPRGVYGTTVKGRIENFEVNQQTDFKTREPLTWKDGAPRMQLVVTLATDERDPTIENDDGRRKLYVKGRMQKVVRDAVQAKAREIAIGGILAVQYYGDEPTEGGDPAKLYIAEYQPPTQAAANGLLGAGQPAAQAAPAAQSQPAASAAPVSGPQPVGAAPGKLI